MKLEITYTPPPSFALVLDEVRTRTKAAAAESADNVVREAQSRVARRTGATSAAIHKEETHDGTGYVVLVTRIEPRNVPYWLEYGTKYMDAKPFLWASVALEEGPAQARMDAAIREGLAAAGYGE